MPSASSTDPTDRPPLAGRNRRAIKWFLIALVVLLAGDLLTKQWAFHSLADRPIEIERVLDGAQRLPPDAVIVVPHVLALKLMLNTGAVFGLGEGLRWIFVAVSVVAVLVISYFFYVSRPEQRVAQLGLAMILAGALGNLYDRVRFGAVRDLLWLFPGVELPAGLSWPSGSRQLYPWIFNLADTYLLIGILLVLLCSMLQRPESEQEENARD